MSFIRKEYTIPHLHWRRTGRKTQTWQLRDARTREGTYAGATVFSHAVVRVCAC